MVSLAVPTRGPRVWRCPEMYHSVGVPCEAHQHTSQGLIAAHSPSAYSSNLLASSWGPCTAELITSLHVNPRDALLDAQASMPAFCLAQ
jgi:hypothetical protein